MTFHFLLIPILLLVIAFLGCGGDRRQPGDVVERGGQPAVIYVEDNDPKMAVAMVKARSTIDQFINALDKPGKSQGNFSVKLAIKDGDQVEHIWIMPVRHEGGAFVGTINNQPDKVRTVKLGDEVKVEKDQISDWMYVENRKLVGGYTIRVLFDNASKEEQEAMARFPFHSTDDSPQN